MLHEQAIAIRRYQRNYAEMSEMDDKVGPGLRELST